MATVTEFPLSTFRALFPVFAPVPDASVQAWAGVAQCMLSDRGHCGCGDHAWMLLTAHLLAVNGLLPAGAQTAPGGNIASATIDKVSVSFQSAPATGSDWAYWLRATTWGQQLLALLSSCGAKSTGKFVGGLPERSAFRAVGGIVPGGRRFR